MLCISKNLNIILPQVSIENMKQLILDRQDKM